MIEEMIDITITIPKSLYEWYEQLTIPAYEREEVSSKTTLEHIAEVVLHTAEFDCYLGRNQYVQERLRCKEICRNQGPITSIYCKPCHAYGNHETQTFCHLKHKENYKPCKITCSEYVERELPCEKEEDEANG
jgi:hypothetical protein